MKPPKFQLFVNGYYAIKNSFKNFFKASFLSIFIIVLILLLLTKMDQAFTLLIDIVENKQDWFAFLLTFIFVNTLAISLSHYPIYTYYSSNLNNSGDYTVWKRSHPYPFWPLKRFPVFTYTTNPQSKYVPDKLANYFRYALGLIIHVIWVHFIIKAFERNLMFDGILFTKYVWVFYIVMLLPLLVYIILKEKLHKINFENTKSYTKDREIQLFKRIGFYYAFVYILSRILLVITVFFSSFSKAGFLLIYITCLSFMFNYVYFRLARTHLSKIETLVKGPLKFFISKVKILEKSEYYLLVFNVSFVIVAIYILYASIASILDLYLPNSLPILLGFFYFYYFIIANAGKYFFVSQKLQILTSGKYKIIFGLTFTFFLLIAITNCSNIENKTHEIDLIDASQNDITETDFIAALQSKTSNNLFFVASHGGGLKSNVWTLNVLNELQKSTQGDFLENTIAFSGASGGSLGLALYTALFKEYGQDYETIQNRIDAIAKTKFTSIDLTLTFGIDSYRKIWPLNQNIGIKDRPYYAMRKYQNRIEKTRHKKLSNQSFRSFWGETFQKEGYFPSLIMNTAGTNGKRGILWSVKQENFDEIFPFAVNLADLHNDQTIPFYQAVSTTNRFPVFSPAAKIPGYGHFIDAGAIDNSGLLGCLDLHNYLLSKDSIIHNKTIVYIEIINSKELYVSYLLDKFKAENQLKHIVKNENEIDNIIADIQTGLNLDKIPGYLSDYLGLLEKNPKNKIRHIPLYMPHKITVNDIENFLFGTIEDKKLKKQISDFLKTENDIIFSVTENPNKSFFETWDNYEPTLSRHLSESSINYIHNILNHPYLQSQFDEIYSLINNNSR